MRTQPEGVYRNNNNVNISAVKTRTVALCFNCWNKTYATYYKPCRDRLLLHSLNKIYTRMFLEPSYFNSTANDLVCSTLPCTLKIILIIIWQKTIQKLRMKYKNRHVWIFKRGKTRKGVRDFSFYKNNSSSVQSQLVLAEQLVCITVLWHRISIRITYHYCIVLAFAIKKNYQCHTNLQERTCQIKTCWGKLDIKMLCHKKQRLNHSTTQPRQLMTNHLVYS